jgi:hypothetical protein
MKRFATITAALALAAPAALAQQSVGTATAEGEDIYLEGVTAESPGYLVVTEELPEGAAGSDPAAIADEPTAVAEVQPGENQTLRIQGDFTYGGRYVIMLYQESGDQEGFQWSDGVEDLPVSEDGEHVTTTFDMMQEAGETETDT